MSINRYSQGHHSERGVVSIFIVVFAAIFMTIITASFITIMITDQQQATRMDLSQSAYDSAMSGVEDAKRALVFCQSPANAGNNGCKEIRNQPDIAGNDCELLGVGKVGISVFGSGQGGNQEVPIQTGVTANSLNQAYTCVGISPKSPNVQLSSLSAGQVSLIPLQSASPFNKVVVSWNTALSSAQTALPSGGDSKFLKSTDWTSIANKYPPVIQATLITAMGSIDQADFDQAPSGSKTGAATLMLRPSQTGITGTGFSSDLRNPQLSSPSPPPSSPNLPTNIKCSTVGPFSAAGPYTCTATIDLGFTLAPAPNKQAFLALQPIYQAADINVALQSNAGDISFSDVQAVVDSTGRANDIFRRVSARVNLVPLTGNYPNAALNLGGSLCKDFTLPQTSPNVYTSNGSICQ